MNMLTSIASDADECKQGSYEKIKTFIFANICQALHQDFLVFSIVRLILTITIPDKCYFL